MAFELVTITTESISLEEVTNRYPDGCYSEAHGCYYFMDYDGEVGYFIQNADNSFESEVQYVDFDTMSGDERSDVYKELTYLK